MSERRREPGALFQGSLNSGPFAVQAAGARLIDHEGREYLDFASGQLCALAGHGHPHLVERLRQALSQPFHLGTRFRSAKVEALMARLTRLAPPTLNRGVLLNTGTEANEFALRLARSAQRPKSIIVSFVDGLHGTSLLTARLGRRGNKHGYSAGLPDLVQIPTPETDPDRFDAYFTHLQAQLHPHRGKIAAFILEPILTAAQVNTPSAEFMRRLSGEIEAHEALLILDETQTGFGRTGRWFGFEHWPGVTPDILVLGKGIGGGYPAAAVLTSDAIEARAVSSGFRHVSSHMNDPLTAAAVEAMIDIVEREGLIQNAARQGEALRAQLERIRGRRPDRVVEVRGRGLLLGVRVIEPDTQPGYAERVFNRCFSRGLVFGYSSILSTFRLLPPLNLAPADIEQAVAIFEGALDE